MAPRANLVRQPAEDIRQEPHAEREGQECQPGIGRRQAAAIDEIKG